MRRRHRHQSIRRRLSRRRDSPSLHLDCRGSTRAPSPPSAAVQPTSAAWRSRRVAGREKASLGPPGRGGVTGLRGLQGFSAPGCHGASARRAAAGGIHNSMCSFVLCLERVVRDKLEGCRKSAGAPLRKASKQAYFDRGRFGMHRPTGIRLDARISAARARSECAKTVSQRRSPCAGNDGERNTVHADAGAPATTARAS